jgi:hypothetical protein
MSIMGCSMNQCEIRCQNLTNFLQGDAIRPEPAANRASANLQTLRLFDAVSEQEIAP